MKAVVVYESAWGSTAAVARAVAEGIGHGAAALSTAEATPEALAGADLVVAGAPVIAFNLTTAQTRPRRENLPPGAPTPDVSHPMMRSWLEGLAPAAGRFAAFETRVRGPFGHSVKTIAQMMEKAGYTMLAPSFSAIVAGRYGGLRDDELDKARVWGAELARKMG